MTLKPNVQSGVSRREQLERELLIDVHEWCETHEIDPIFPFPAAMTRQLCDAVERIPFREIGQRGVPERGLDLLERARVALERSLRVAEDDLALEYGFETSFAAPLRSRATEPAWRRIALRCGPSDDGKPAITLGLEGEL